MDQRDLPDDPQQAAFLEWMWQNQQPLVRVEGLPIEVYVRKAAPADSMLAHAVRAKPRAGDDELAFVRSVAVMALRADGSVVFDPNDDVAMTRLHAAWKGGNNALNAIIEAHERVNRVDEPPKVEEPDTGN